MAAYLLYDPFQQYLEISAVFGLSICMAKCNNSIVGSENDLLQLLFLGLRGVGVLNIIKR